MYKILTFLLLFCIGEFIFNLTWFNYLKDYFKFEEETTINSNEKNKPSKKFLLLNLSTFKGILERFIITIGLNLGFAPILIVFGTLKLGTRFKDNQDIKNDYFLIGNLSTILISIFYYFMFKEILKQHSITF